MGSIDLSNDELLSTTRSVRKRLDFDRPVEPEVIRECLELALQAPSGSNSQGWQFVVVTDAEKRAALGDMYRRAFDIYETMEGNAGNAYQGDDPTRLATQDRVMTSARYLADHMGEAPVLLIPCITPRTDQMPAMAQSAILGSILPAAWSFALAARARGLGTSWTTLHLMFEEEAAELLGIPFAEFMQTALLPVAYTKGTNFKPAHREPLDTVLHWDSW
ncbi:MAG: nitroreductase family protein [Actinomycetota bacterium]